VNINLLKNTGETSIFIMDAIMKKKVVPYFQPIVNARDKSIMAYEVLTRIVTTDKVIPAAEFIEVAETMGVIGKIDLLLIEQAFDAVKRNSFAGKLFINLSPKALLLNEFIPHVRRHLVASGLEPSQLVFEITERETVKNLDQIGRILRGLQQEGFQIAIDDFGAGYSSFQYLKLFKADYLKVDGEFIRNLSDNSGLEHVIVASISQLAKYLKIKTIAEFVESGDILEIVCSADINYAQGYHVGRPLPDMIR
jgi:EAL domain-containing protein (putative c-di-GMP-specific phosphodiesterase class I)